MDHVNAVLAALKGTAPVLAIPVEGHAPVCIRAKLLKGALKGVEVRSVVLLENGCLKVTGMAAGSVRTSSTFVPIARWKALMEIRDWTIKEREKRVKVINQGVLNAQTRRELKKKEIEGEADKVLAQARKHEQRILANARTHGNPLMVPALDHERQRIVAEYAAFRGQRRNRKRGSVVRWKLAKLRAQVKEMTVEKREYEVREVGSGYHRRNRKVMTGKKTVLRRKKDIVKYAALVYQIGTLEKKLTALYPPLWQASEYIGNGGYFVDSFITKRPNGQTVSPKDWWRGKDEDRYDRKAEARRLQEARADIRALTPPADEAENLEIAA
jgi:hypothetical protein